VTDEARDILQRELTRCALALTEMDPAREHKSYGELVHTIETLIWMTNAPDTASPVVGVEQEPYIPAEIKVIPAEEMTEEDKADAAAVIEAAEEAKTYSREEVRAALARSRKNGVNVTELLAEFGVDNFSAVPAGRYPELMAKLGES
jgi:hypothetical protein